jgi:hypothetical protein
MAPHFEIEALKHFEGPLYTKQRDAWLRDTPNAREILRQQEQQPEWRTKVTAKILLVWLERRAEAESLLRDIDHVDWAKERSKVSGRALVPESGTWGSDHPELHAAFLPLCWEAVLKRRKEWPEDKRWIFFAMMQRAADELSLEVLAWYLQAIADTRSERALAVSGLLRMPPAKVEARMASLSQQTKDVRVLIAMDFPGLYPNDPTAIFP